MASMVAGMAVENIGALWMNVMFITISTVLDYAAMLSEMVT